MTWVKIDDRLNQNPKVRGVSMAARWTYISSICRASETLSDGLILRSDLTLVDGTPRLAKELVDAGLWENDPKGWRVHDYLVYNRSREQIEDLSRKYSANGSKRGANGSADGSPNRSANGSPNRSTKHPEDGSDSLHQNARSAAAAPPTGVDYSQQKQKHLSDSLSDSLDNPEADQRYRRICDRWLLAVGTTLNREAAERLVAASERTSEEWVADAIAVTGAANGKSPNHTLSVLQRWEREGRTTATPAAAAPPPKPELPPTVDELDEMYRNRPLRRRGNDGS